MEKGKKTENSTPQQIIKYRVNYGVHIVEMGKIYSKQELESDPEACAYLEEIESQAVTRLDTI